MRYRIKIITYKSGEQVFIPQKRAFIGWLGIDYDGALESLPGFNTRVKTRQRALEFIDLHYKGNRKKVRIEIEYINKN